MLVLQSLHKKPCPNGLRHPLSNKRMNKQYVFDYSPNWLLASSMKITKISYQAKPKDSAKMTKVESRQLPDKPKAPKMAKPELKPDQAKHIGKTGTPAKRCHTRT